MTLQPGDTLLNGQYRVLGQVGRGGFGSVYLSYDTLLGEEVAVKELIPTLIGDQMMSKRFLAEAKATMRLNHDRIVRTHNVFSEGGTYYIAMEYMAGGSLEARLQAQSVFAVEEAVRIAAEVCEGLHYAHQRGVVHCDLKPANILFTADGSAKVADFGIAHVSEQLLTRTWQTSIGFVAGTLPYMSPEQADGVRDDPRIDVYALGAVLYRILTGRNYLDFDQRDTPGAQADNVLRIRTTQTTPPSVHNSRIPPWLDKVVVKALDKRPGDRFASADELRVALLGQKPVPPRTAAPTQPQAEPVQPQARSREKLSHPQQGRLPAWFWPVAGGTVALCVVIVIAVALVFGGAGNGTPTPFVVTYVVAPQITASLPPTPEAPIATSTPTSLPPTATPVPLAYQDDFDDPNSGWSAYDQGNTWAGYQEGEYRLAVYEPDLVTWGDPEPPPNFSDFEIEVDARLMEGPQDNNFGLVVRYQPDGTSFYWFQISSDGYYAVDILRQGEFSSLVSWEASAAINQGLGAINRLKMVCEGNRLSLYVNDVYLAAVTDDTFVSGSIGLAVGTFDEAGVVVHFDNLTVRIRPE